VVKAGGWRFAAPGCGYVLAKATTADTRQEGTQMDDGRRLQWEGKWDQMRGRVKQSWGVLTDDELDQTEGKWDRVVGLIKEKTGETAEAIERRLDDMTH
jgi:uncharacterized protein YjbJ (UPF0337 family)